MAGMSLKQFAALIDKHFGTVQLWARDGRINAVKIGGAFRIDDEEYQRYLREGHLVPFKDRPPFTSDTEGEPDDAD